MVGLVKAVLIVPLLDITTMFLENITIFAVDSAIENNTVAIISGVLITAALPPESMTQDLRNCLRMTYYSLDHYGVLTRPD